MERGEFKIRLEESPSGYHVFGRWTLCPPDDRPEHATDIYLGKGHDKEEALRIAGLFGLSTAFAVGQLAKDQGKLVPGGSTYTVTGTAESIPCDPWAQAERMLHEATYAHRNLCDEDKESAPRCPYCGNATGLHYCPGPRQTAGDVYLE
ncbi:hypothetical protein [Paenibacillus sp. BK720]|uniref:hypothetical protein n=1 Tax=Paenibacillus sp. BK720 TaxID=2587092 RepID=UPI00141F52C5|nr:hypothetical protein [Paenibacillus sp. BK720]NIK67919.1 hypothetical protein [Paenibacillus sp. BK720]